MSLDSVCDSRLSQVLADVLCRVQTFCRHIKMHKWAKTMLYTKNDWLLKRPAYDNLYWSWNIVGSNNKIRTIQYEKNNLTMVNYISKHTTKRIF